MAESCILITGGAGFIGCALSRKLISRGYQVVVLDNLLEQVHPRQERPEDLPAEAELWEADVRDPAVWNDLLARYSPETVFHFAAETGTAQSLFEASRHTDVNVNGTAMMLDAFAKLKVVPRRIILSSSRAVYGEGLWQASDETRFYPGSRTHAQLSLRKWVPEGPDGKPGVPLPHSAADVWPRPTSVYGATKLAQEHVLAAWCSAFDVPLAILRLQNVYGPGQSPTNPYTGIINLFHRVAHARQPIQVYEDGLIGRDFVFITDVVDAMLAAMDAPSVTTAFFDVGTGRATTILEAAETIAALHGAPAPEICGKFRDGDVRSAVADISGLVSELGVTPSVQFREGAKRVGDWLLAKGYA